MAMPISARRRAGASLTPSPVMATMAPVRFRPSTMRNFCSGLIRAKIAARRIRDSRSPLLSAISSSPVTAPLFPAPRASDTIGA